ncbi:hypothetical protein H8S95_10185 [Pontibacter sp. KCTC 32443]|uniref:TapB family protein n=1 Tax=Pontibacter TaxID=323449 RepID=UPI00164E12D4|nr:MULTISPECIES: hypothetical protein [Pontibacter]MBC5774430.1 hypothetical protein [Pontibacter sp. KCTC 32443]
MGKKAICFLMVLMATIVSVPLCVLAQDCAGYYLFVNKAEYELIHYDKKDKLTGRVYHKITSVNSSPTKTEATIHSKRHGEEGNLTTEGDYTVYCQEGSVFIDIGIMVNPDLLEAHQNADIKIQGDQLEYPSTLAVGQTLKDGSSTIDVLDKKNGQILSSIVVTITGRTVSEKESINVPAGAYNAYKIKQDMEIRTRTDMNKQVTRLQIVEYFAPGIGMVRSESYKNGKLIAYSVLSKANK